MFGSVSLMNAQCRRAALHRFAAWVNPPYSSKQSISISPASGASAAGPMGPRNLGAVERVQCAAGAMECAASCFFRAGPLRCLQAYTISGGGGDGRSGRRGATRDAPKLTNS